MAIEKPPIQQPFNDPRTGFISREWAAWVTKLWILIGRTGLNGTTAQRPTTGLYIGMQYFDTTIGKPIWLQRLSPLTWRLADGTAV